MMKWVKIQIGLAGHSEFFDAQALDVKQGDLCVVQLEKGVDAGEVLEAPRILDNLCAQPSLKRVIRLAEDADRALMKTNEAKARQSEQIVKDKVCQLNVPMKILALDYALDSHQMRCYFKAKDRVDFRVLARELAGIFKTRIELRQVGVRDEAKLIGGIGPCGRELCCSSHLKQFTSVSTDMAKAQGLGEAAPKVSGVCGKLMCCLAYEYDAYIQASQKMPQRGQAVVLNQGEGRVVEPYLLPQRVLVKMKDSGEVVDVPVHEIKTIRSARKGVGESS